MIRAALVLFGSFGLCAALGTAGAGCWGNDCECPDGPPLPSTLAAQRISESSVYSTDASDPFDLRNGTMAIEGAKLVFHYDASGTSHEIVYKIFPNP